MAEKKKRDFEPLPYYRWYVRAYRASRRVQKLHHSARGIYRELIDECWLNGSIPDDAAKCADLIGFPAKYVERHWPAVREMFQPIGDKMLAHDRLENERTDADRLRVVRAIAGRRGGKASGKSRSKRSKSKQIEATGSNLLSSSSSSKQSKSSSACLEDGSPPDAALAPQGARVVGLTPVGAEIARFEARFGTRPVS